jgi:hypothetical protein
MNAPHPAQVTPSWYGDSVGHYEGDTLVVDTVGIMAERPHAMICKRRSKNPSLEATEWFGCAGVRIRQSGKPLPDSGEGEG